MKPSKPGNEHLPQYLTFQLHDGTYAIAIEFISEIRAIGTVTPLPGSPDYVRGIMNLRGTIVPVVDLRTRLGLPPVTQHSRFAVTIITKHQNKNIGLIADGVNEVLCIPDSKWGHPKSLEQADQRFIQGLALLTDTETSDSLSASMIVLLNLDKLYDPSLNSFPQPGTANTTVQNCGDSIAGLYNGLNEPHTSINASPREITA